VFVGIRYTLLEYMTRPKSLLPFTALCSTPSLLQPRESAESSRSIPFPVSGVLRGSGLSEDPSSLADWGSTPDEDVGYGPPFGSLVVNGKHQILPWATPKFFKELRIDKPETMKYGKAKAHMRIALVECQVL